MPKSKENLETSFDSGFLEDYLGTNISSNPITAIVELIANAWDAGASEVKIEWSEKIDDNFSIIDNGEGLTSEEFQARWTKLSYNRLEHQGKNISPPLDNKIPNERSPYGRNGKGRFAAFCFGGNEYFVETKNETSHSCYKISKASGQKEPLLFDEISLPSPSLILHKVHGTAVYANQPIHIGISEDRIRSEIGMRFLADPNFTVFVNNKKVVFGDIDSDKVSRLSFLYKEKSIPILAIYTTKVDKTTQQHGVAWHVNNRLVGNCDWEGIRNDTILDGRSSVAKKYTFIVEADIVSNYVNADWSGFKNNEEILDFYDKAKEEILKFISNLNIEKRTKRTKKLIEKNSQELNNVGLIGNTRWQKFIDDVQVKCPTINDDELNSIAKILANLEASTSQYSLIHKLSDYTSENLDDLNKILTDWDITSAKAVLDEIETRLLLIEELRRKIHDKNTLEVQELQPLFNKGLWIFGPEFESIEYTSNQGMTTVIQDLLGGKETGSKNRPDFVILPESSVGLYGCYEYGIDGNEKGIKKVIIVELKRPGMTIGEKEKNQCWKYIKELYEKGAILPEAKVECYLLGEKIEQAENFERKERKDAVIIYPMVFDTILKRAETRLLKLHEKVKEAPFLKDSDTIKILDAKLRVSQKQITLTNPANS